MNRKTVKKIFIAPSILSADLLNLKQQIKIVEENKADFIHVDVMDGHFVPNITFGPMIVRALRSITDLPLDVHLMISDPDKYIEQFATAGATNLTVHPEINPHLQRTIQNIKDNGCKAGVALNPSTAVSVISEILGEIDIILPMTVNPGFGGQEFIARMLKKIGNLAQLKSDHEYKYLIEVDGGINVDTIPAVVQAGAEILVAGEAIFGEEDIAKACIKLREVAENSIKNE
jgi:ribulose-phosphate 3-epimerase